MNKRRKIENRKYAAVAGQGDYEFFDSLFHADDREGVAKSYEDYYGYDDYYEYIEKEA